MRSAVPKQPEVFIYRLKFLLSVFILFAVSFGFPSPSHGSDQCHNLFAKEISAQPINLARLTSQGSTVTVGPNGSSIITVNVAAAKKKNDFEILNVVDKYLDHTMKVYQIRLRKFEDDSTGTSDSSTSKAATVDKELAERSILVMDTAPSQNLHSETKFFGGLRLTFSRGAHEKLPFQHEFGEMNTAHPDHVNVEVGRLTAAGADSARRSMNLIQMAFQLTAQMPYVKDIYVHTSKVHTRLYRIMGFTPKEVIAIDDLNYILRFSRAELMQQYNIN